MTPSEKTQVLTYLKANLKLRHLYMYKSWQAFIKADREWFVGGFLVLFSLGLTLKVWTWENKDLMWLFGAPFLIFVAWAVLAAVDRMWIVKQLDWEYYETYCFFSRKLVEIYVADFNSCLKEMGMGWAVI